MDQGDERQLRFAVPAKRFQKRGFDFLTVEGFVLVELRGAKRVLLPGIIQGRDLLRRALLVPKPQFLGRRSSLPRKGDLAGIGNGKSIWIGRYPRGIFECAFRRESDKFRGQPLPDTRAQPPPPAP